MRYLLDTQILIWAAISPKDLSDQVRNALIEPANTLFVSHASIWEMQIKHNLGKLDLGYEVDDFLKKQLQDLNLGLISITTEHIFQLAHVPLYKDHRDPFDRMLIAQAAVEGLTLITADHSIRQFDYGIPILWE